MKRILAWILGCLCCLGAAGAFATEAQEAVTFSFEGAVVAFQGWHEDTSVLDQNTKDPQGRYVMVQMAVEEGEVPWKMFTEDFSKFVLDTSEGQYITGSAIAHGIRIGDDSVMAVGTIDLIFDLPEGVIPEKLTILLGDEPLEITLAEAMELTSAE